ncbi:hypothetical protein ACLOJK_032363 [Asimina triloba]
MRIRSSHSSPPLSPRLPFSSPLSSLPSSSSSSTPSSLNSSSALNDKHARCQGLDLLVEAVSHLAGPVVFGSVAFTRKKVIRRGKRALRFKTAAPKESGKGEKEKKKKKKKKKNKEAGIGLNSEQFRQKRLMSLPSKYRDSVLLPLKRKSRQRANSPPATG